MRWGGRREASDNRARSRQRAMIKFSSNGLGEIPTMLLGSHLSRRNVARGRRLGRRWTGGADLLVILTSASRLDHSPCET
jgi:hypothetical protein